MSKPRDIDYLLEEVVTLPSLRGSIAHIIGLLDNPETPLAEVGKAVSADPSIALKTLRLVNSAYYGVRQKVASVEQAVVLLGAKVIKNLAVTAMVFETLGGQAGSYLHHSIYCGAIMRELARARRDACPVESIEEAFVYGLLHDVGKVVFEQFLPEESARAAEEAHARHEPLYRVEREIVGVDHGLMGARLALKWKLPDPLVNAIAGHHDLAQCEDPAYRSLAAHLSVADYICAACGVTVRPDDVVVVEEDLWEASSLTGRDIPPILDAFFAALPDVEELIYAIA